MNALRILLPRAIDDPVFALRGALVFVAAFAFTRGWRYTIDLEPVPMGIQLISPDASVRFWGIAWFVACAIALIGIPKAWPLVSLGVVALSLAFAYGFTLAWVGSLGSVPGSPGRSDYANASTYWTSLGLLAFGYPLSRRALKGSESTDEE